jgi:hypothetical protein
MVNEAAAADEPALSLKKSTKKINFDSHCTIDLDTVVTNTLE